MERISVSDASLTLADLVDRVVQDGVAIDLERGDRVVARLSPVPTVSLTVDELNRMFQGWRLLAMMLTTSHAILDPVHLMD